MSWKVQQTYEVMATEPEFSDDNFLKGFVPRSTTAKGLGEVLNYQSKEICTERYDDDLVDQELSRQTNGYVCSNRE